ncbi:MAG: YifB family Mg chelatase-like AAA ATPase [Steroidobacteraceae bacterium]
MGFAQVLSRAHVGMAAPLVRVEVHLGSGLPSFTIVGLAAPVVRESKERVRAALAHCGYEFPAGRITVNLAPADLPKEGGRFDLPIALGILLASGQAQPHCDLERTEFYGELGLTGELKAVPGLLLAAMHAGAAGHALYVPEANGSHLAAATVAEVRALRDLRDIATGAAVLVRPPSAAAGQMHGAMPELADVRGQWQAKRALLIAAAGAHSLLMQGPPGSGKSMLAQRLPALLPPLSREEALEVAAIAAVAQCAPGGTHALEAPAPPGATRRPFRAPHHTASAHAIVGGGVAVRPGEVSLAHHGVLFLDELPEFDRRVLEALREPLESGRVSVVRANQRAEYPAAFQLVAAMNPCPCGRAGMVHPRCRCQPAQITRYRARISGPLLDRIDLQLQLPPVDASHLTGTIADTPDALTTARAQRAVCAARERQLARQGMVNSRLDPDGTLRHCSAGTEGMALLRRAVASRGYSARSQHRILRVARSIADLDDRHAVKVEDVAEALGMRWDD